MINRSGIEVLVDAEAQHPVALVADTHKVVGLRCRRNDALRRDAIYA